jgi:glucosyl-3-phosphoglycerate synthase
VPVIAGCDVSAALAAATAIATQVQLLGIVAAAPDTPISAHTEVAGALRKRLRTLSWGPQIRYQSQVIVSQEPWRDLLRQIDEQQPDLLVLDLAEHLPALGLTPEAILDVGGCDVVLVRGPWPAAVRHVLMPVRGGPQAELVLTVGMSMSDVRLTALHLTPENMTPDTDAPFRGLSQVLRNLSEIVTEQVRTDQPVAEILARAAEADLIVIGASARPDATPQAIGPVVAGLLQESAQPLLIVKSRRVRVIAQPTEAVGQGAISILVDKWFAENTFTAEEFADLHALVAAKQERGLTVSLALPALNEEETVGRVIRTVKHALMENVPLLDEIVLIDSNSTDRTREIAAELGVPVYIHQEILPQYGARRGKGEALWKSLYVTRGEIIAWIDTDIFNIHPRFVYGIIGPLILHDHVQYVKGFYRRPLKVGDKMQAGGGGRVTELMARPLINLFYPELSGVIQPLSGEYAGRRGALEQAAFYSGYGVETGMLIDVFERHGLAAIAQVDLLERVHHNQPLEALSKMSFAILQTVMQRLETRIGHAVLADVNRTMKLVRYQRGAYFLDVEEVAERPRPPMIELPEYRAAQTQLARVQGVAP